MNVPTTSTAPPNNGYPRTILSDPLTALLGSWSPWNCTAGSEQAGRTWCTGYLRFTYDCGTYIPYEAVMRQAARNIGLPASAPVALEANQLQLASRSDVAQTLARLQPHCRLIMVANCSERLGRQAATPPPIMWDVVIMTEQAGVYRPDSKSYHMALEQLDVDAADAILVADSSYDMFGTATIGLRTY